MQSIIQKDMNSCYICGARASEVHHVFFGKNRKISDKYKLVVALCPNCHRGTNGVHGRDGASVDLFLKQTGQQAFEKQYSHGEFMRLFGKNYL